MSDKKLKNYYKFNLTVAALVLVAGVAFWGWKQGYRINQPSRVLSAQTAYPTLVPTPFVYKYAFPDPTLTPGDVFADTTEAQICVSGYTATVRDVSVTLKRQVYEEYGLSYPQAAGAYEADHFIPLELGGSNNIKNLWPEQANPIPGFHQKDVVENYLHQQVCDGKMTLIEAQTEIKNNWLSVYDEINK